jgi:RNA 3'-terminal phosphate cyclase (ATP)
VREELDVDGSRGEGGGQILRTSLTLSLVTGTPIRVHRIRAGRDKPGLLRQHLAAVRAAAAVGDAEVEGADIGSTELRFHPRGLRGGDHRFAVGSAGSAGLLFQTVLPALLLAPEPSRLVFEGGTHNPWAPPYDALARGFLPLLTRLGARVETHLTRRGYYPAGGGSFTAVVEPGAPLHRLDLPERGEVRSRTARVLLANLPRIIAEREAAMLRRLLPADLWSVEIEAVDDATGPGNAVLLEVECDHVTEVFSSFGDVRVRAETVAENVVREMRAWLAAEVPVGPHLADQLLLPLALGSGGSFRTTAPTGHARTNAEVIAMFLPDRAPVLTESGTTATATVPGPAVPAHGG